jgi:SAM-dependent methyltransferase
MMGRGVFMTEPGEWHTIAETADDIELRDRILTGFRDGKPFTPYVPTIALPSPIERVLDFGCGVGRNFPYLKSIAAQVTGFDLPPMIARCRRLAPAAADALASDWDDVRTQQFDLVFASLVLQHLETGVARARLADFARMAPAVYVITRREGDFGADMLRLIAESGLSPAGDCVEVDHDPATHQLRVLRRGALAELLDSARTGHYELLLQPRR